MKEDVHKLKATGGEEEEMIGNSFLNLNFFYIAF